MSTELQTRTGAAIAEAARKADETSEAQAESSGRSTALVLADRNLVIRSQVTKAYPKLRKSRVTYSGGGYGSGHAAGQKADIGGAKVGSGSGRALGR